MYEFLEDNVGVNRKKSGWRFNRHPDLGQFIIDVWIMGCPSWGSLPDRSLSLPFPIRLVQQWYS
jgi:hypothetical protein